MRQIAVALACLVLLVSGCAGQKAPTDDPVAPSTNSPTKPLPPTTTLPPDVTIDPGNGATNVTDWGVLEFEAQGGPGTWIIGYQPLNRTPSRYILDFEASATSPAGQPVGLLVFAPQATTQGEGIEIAPEAHPRLLIEPLGGQVRWAEEVQVSGFEAAVPGVFFAVASVGGPWSFSFRLEIGSGETARPSFITGGQETLMGYAAGLSPGAGQARLTMPIPGPGWTHFSVLFHNPPLCPRDGYRQHDIRFADGETQVQTGWEPNARYDFAGTLTDRAGNFSALVTYAEASSGVELGAMHLPAGPEHFPKGFTLGGYRRANGEPCED